MLKKLLFVVVLFHFLACTVDREFPIVTNPIENEDYETIHYWNFNDISSSASLIAPTVSNSGNPSLTYDGTFDHVIPGSEINLRFESETGSALRLRNPSNNFVMHAPTIGYKDVVLRYAATRTGSGSQTQKISYSLDGVNFTQSGLAQNEFSIFEDIFVLIQIDFKDIVGVNNNPNFKVKIEFDAPSAIISNGNNRIDNLSFDGIPTETPPPTDENLYLLHYWDFNNATSNETLVNPTLGNGQLTYLGNFFDSVSPGSDVNLRNESTIGSALRLRNASGDFIISIPTTGHQNIQLKYAATRTGSGSQTQTIFYSVDGINYTQNGLETNQFSLTEDIYNLINIDFSSISAADNNPNFKVKIVFDEPSANISNGNNRLDNITLEGNVL
jgi:hypothetical protein